MNKMNHNNSRKINEKTFLKKQWWFHWNIPCLSGWASTMLNGWNELIFECKLALIVIMLWLSVERSQFTSHHSQTQTVRMRETEMSRMSVCQYYVLWPILSFYFESNNERKPVFSTRDESNKQYHKMLNIDADAITIK